MSIELTHEDEKNIRVKILKVHDLLQSKYGKQIRNGKANPLDELIITILAQNTTETQSHQSFDRLRKKFKGWEALMASPTQAISKAMHAGGLKNTKALRLKRVLKRIYRDQGALSLDFLRELEIKEALKYLLSLKGIGLRTASSVLLFSLNRPIMPINTHIERVSKRIGWLYPQATPEEAQEVFDRTTPRYLVMSLFSQLVKHGRVVCKAKKPSCTTCGVRHFCEYYKKSQN